MLCRYCWRNLSRVGGQISLKGVLVSTQNLCDCCGQLIPCFVHADEQNSMVNNIHEAEKDAVAKECSEASTSGSSISISTAELNQALRMDTSVQPFKDDQQLMVDKDRTLFVDSAQQQEQPPETARKIYHIHGFNSKLFADVDTTGFPRTVFASATQLNEPKDLNSPSKQLEVHSNQESLINPNATFIKPGLVKAIRDKIEYAILHDSPRRGCEISTLNSEKNRSICLTKSNTLDSEKNPSICLTKSIQTQVYEYEEAVSLHLNGLGINGSGSLWNGEQNVYKVMESTCTTTTVHLEKNAENINVVKCEKKLPASFYEELTAAVKLHGNKQINKNRQTENTCLASNLDNEQSDLLVGKKSTIGNSKSIIPNVKELSTVNTALLKLKDQKVPTVDRVLKNSFNEEGRNTNPSALQKVSVFKQADPN